MTIEEKAEKRTEEKYACNEKEIMPLEAIGYKKGYLTGAKENGVVWHDLRKDVYDLPAMIEDERKISQDVWLHIKNWGREVGYYDYNKNFWVVKCRQVNLSVIAWCEIPQFKGE